MLFFNIIPAISSDLKKSLQRESNIEKKKKI